MEDNKLQTIGTNERGPEQQTVNMTEKTPAHQEADRSASEQSSIKEKQDANPPTLDDEPPTEAFAHGTRLIFVMVSLLLVMFIAALDNVRPHTDIP